MGMVASLGLDAPTCCAAARAGLSRSRELPFAFNDVQSKKTEHAIGHQAPFLTEGFEGPARLVRLLAGALRDLERLTGAPPAARTGFYLSLPGRHRHLSGAEIAVNDEVGREMAELAGQCAPEQPYDYADSILRHAVSSLRWPGVPDLRFVTTAGQTGTAEAINSAVEDLWSGTVDSAIVAGADSLIEEETLVWLQVTGRLKSSAVPAGLMPGEAAALVVLEAVRSSGQAGACIARSSLRQDKGAFLRGDPPLGIALSEVAREAAGQHTSDAAPAWIIADLNGEPYRAIDWGNASTRALPLLKEPLLWCPAVSFGDTGAASGAVALCLAVKAFERGYAPAPRSIVLSAADGPGRASMCLTADVAEAALS